MRRNFLIFFVSFSLILLTLAATVPVVAVEGDTGGEVSGRLEELRQLREQKIDLLRQRQEAKQDEIISRRRELKERIATQQAEARRKTIERIVNVFIKILERMETALERLDKIANRTASRIDKLNDKGIDTSAAARELAEAETFGTSAAQAIEEARGSIDAIDAESSTVREAVGAAKEAVSGAKRALRAYHRALVEVIREIKSAQALREATISGND